jgi:hypothetical protein
MSSTDTTLSVKPALLLSLLSLCVNSVISLFYCLTVGNLGLSLHTQFVFLLLNLSTIVPACQLVLSENIQITTSARWFIQIVMLFWTILCRGTSHHIGMLIYPNPDFTPGHPKQGRHASIRILTSSPLVHYPHIDVTLVLPRQ